MTSVLASARGRDRLSRLASTRADRAAFRGEAISELKRVIGFDGWCWASTDPLTGLTTAALADNPSMNGTIRQLFELEYGPADVNGYRELARRRQVGRLLAATQGNLAGCRRWVTLLGPRGVGDELRVTFADRGQCWGHLALYRGSDGRAFTAADGRVLAPLLRSWAARHRQEAQAALGSGPSAPTSGPEAGQAVLLLTATGALVAQSELAGRLLDALPHRTGPGRPPLVVTALAAWLSARPDQGTSPAVPVCDAAGRWQRVQAHRLDGAVAPGTVAITLAAATPAQLAPLAMVAAGLTARERQIAALALTGLPNTQIAAEASISPYTVQDHLRSVFRKLAVTGRHQLAARLYSSSHGHPPAGPHAGSDGWAAGRNSSPCWLSFVGLRVAPAPTSSFRARRLGRSGHSPGRRAQPIWGVVVHIGPGGELCVPFDPADPSAVPVL